MRNDQDALDALVETARNLESQSGILRRQAEDLRKEAARIRAAVKTARKARAEKLRK